MWVPELEEESGKNYIKFQVLGESNVAVPTHLFKVNLYMLYFKFIKGISKLD